MTDSLSSRWTPESQDFLSLSLRPIGTDLLFVGGLGGFQVMQVREDGPLLAAPAVADSGFTEHDAALDPSGRYLVVGSDSQPSPDQTGRVSLWDLGAPGGTVQLAVFPTGAENIDVERCGPSVFYADGGTTLRIDDASMASAMPPASVGQLRGSIRTLVCTKGLRVTTTSDGLVEVHRSRRAAKYPVSYDDPLFIRKFDGAARPRTTDDAVTFTYREQRVGASLDPRRGLSVRPATSRGDVGCHARPRIYGHGFSTRCGTIRMSVSARAPSRIILVRDGGRRSVIRTRDAVQSLTLDVDRGLLFVGHQSYTATLWDVTDPQLPAEILELTLPVVVDDAAFSADGETLAVEYHTPPGPPTGVLVFGIGSEFLQSEACRLAGRTLTRAEIRRFAGSDEAPRACR